jgi:putative ABC transport system substrate-binding protein
MFSKGTIVIFIIVLCIGAFIAIKGVSNYKQSSEAKLHKIGIIQAIEHPALDTTRDGIIAAIKELGQGKIKIVHESAQGDIALAQQIIQKFSQQKVSAIITIGTTVTQVAMQQTKSIPIIFASVTDPVGSGIIVNLNAPEANLTGTSNFTPNITSIQLKFFKKLIPQLETIGIIYNPSETNSVKLVDDVKAKALEFNMKVKAVPIQDTNEAILTTRTILDKIEAIFINNDNTALGALKGIVDIAMKYKIPVFCSDMDTIPLGVLAAVGPNQFKLGQIAGKQAIEIVLHKKSVSGIPVKYAEDNEFVVNAETAAKLGIKLTIDNTTLTEQKIMIYKKNLTITD